MLNIMLAQEMFTIAQVNIIKQFNIIKKPFKQIKITFNTLTIQDKLI